MNEASLHRWETEEEHRPPLDVVERLARVLGCDRNDLLPPFEGAQIADAVERANDLPPVFEAFYQSPAGIDATPREKAILENPAFREGMKEGGLEITHLTLTNWLSGIRVGKKRNVVPGPEHLRAEAKLAAADRKRVDLTAATTPAPTADPDADVSRVREKVGAKTDPQSKSKKR